MFDKLFKSPNIIKRFIDAPILEDRLRYLTFRAEQGNKQWILREIAYYQIILIKYLSLEKKRVLTLKEINSTADRTYSNRPSNSKNPPKKRFIRYATEWLSFLGRLKISVEPVPEMIVEFGNHLRQERNLCEITVTDYCSCLQRFFDQIKKDPKEFLEDLTPAYLDEMLIQKLKEGIYARSYIKSIVSTIRIFLHYAQDRRWCHPGIADSIKMPRSYALQALPLSPSWEDVQRLLKTTEGNSPVNIRDRAIILLLAVYGLRDSEARRLRLDDFDWNEGTFHIKRSKFGPIQKFPLVPTVGRALARYIKKIRPRKSANGEVFLTLTAPYRPLVTFYSIVSRKWKPLNVSIKHHGPHSLRHACASRLINQGMSLKTIADQLGHRDLETTRIYAKVDLPRLREVANFNIGGLL